VVNDFLTYGDPSLKETVKKIIPFTRNCILIEEDCSEDSILRSRLAEFKVFLKNGCSKDLSIKELAI